MSKKTVAGKRYTDVFKAEAVRLVENGGGRTVGEIARSLGVARNGLHAWKRQHDGTRGSDHGGSAKQELHRLRREVADLKRDRDTLVESIAVFVRDRK